MENTTPLSVSEQQHIYFDQDEERAAEGHISLSISFPNGTTSSISTPFSQTVEYVKFVLIRLDPDFFDGVSFGLYLNDNRLIEPMSLNDYDTISPDTPTVLEVRLEN
ncbi:hypothetical protein GEMRC1_002616 [Eukaryota sp. GEM-RC1]